MSRTVAKKPVVLIVEDNAITLKMMRLALESAGYGVLEAPDGKTAVRLVKKTPPDLILQDLLLPDVDGLDLVTELRKSLGARRIPILACTGLMSRLEEARTLNGAFTDFLFKPVEPSRLLQTIERYLATGAGRAKAREKIKVLMVDDDPIELKLEKLLLEAQGFTVTTAKDGQDAWETIQRSRPDAVVTDLIMPGMNGFDLCTTLRKDRRYAALPIVITSSTAPFIEDEDRELAAKVGADAFVGRTPDLKDVVKALRAALSRRSHPRPAADSENLKDRYLQRIVSQLEQQSLRNGDLIRHAAEEKAQLAVMASITETLNKKLPLRAALDEALARILDAAGLSMGIVYLAGSDGALVLESQVGYARSKLDELRRFFGHPELLRLSLDRRKTLTMPSPDIAPAIGKSLRGKIQARSLLIAPLVAADEPQGVLVVFSSRSELGEEWANSVKTVAAQLAQAVLLARTLEKVSESEQRFRELAENINEIFYSTGPDGTPVHYVSPAFKQITGHGAEGFYGNPRFWLDIIHPEDRGRVERAQLGSPENFAAEYRVIRPGGSIRWLQSRSFPVRDASGKTVRIVGTAEDITKRKLAEQARDRQFRDLDTLHQLSQAALNSLDQTKISEEVLERLMSVGRLDMGVIRILESDGRTLRPAAWRGYRDPGTLRVHDMGLDKTGSPSLIPRLIRARATKTFDSIFEADGLRTLQREGVKSAVFIPILAEGRIIGTVQLGARAPRKFTAEDTRLYEAIANQAGLALQKAELHAQTERNLNRIRALHAIDVAITSTLDLHAVLNVLLEKIELFFPLGAASTVRLVDPESGELSSVACRNIDEAEWKAVTARTKSDLGRMLAVKDRPEAVRNAQADPRSLAPRLLKKYGLVSYLRVPLIALGRVLGVLTVFTKEEHEFTPEESEFLTTLGGQAAIAIHNAQLYEQTKKQTEALERSNRVKDEFLSVMSHELRTPLSVIMGYTGLVRDGMLGEMNAAQTDALKKVLGRAGEQLNMINDIMQTTQIESRSMAVERLPVDLKEMMDSLKQDFEIRSDKSSAAIVWDCPAGPVEISTDAAKLKQILQNLVNNALKFTKAGTVTVSVRLENLDSRRVVCRVADTGVGIPKDQLAVIFDKFYQVDSSETRLFGGVGLGLYIVKKFTDLLGGTIEVRSEVGKGAAFTVTLPAEVPRA